VRRQGHGRRPLSRRLYRRAARTYDLGPGGWSYLSALGLLASDHGRARVPGVDSGLSVDGCCMGPMQFVHATWRRFGVDADGDGRRSPYDRRDAVFGAAHMLDVNGAPDRWRRALWAYNPSPRYVADAQRHARRMRRRARAEARPGVQPDRSPGDRSPGRGGRGDRDEAPGVGNRRESERRSRRGRRRSGFRPSREAREDIPKRYLRLYRRAAREFELGRRGWSVLAAVGKIETDHGRLDAAGVDSGENPWGAGGPMQFLQPTWEAYGVDGDGDGAVNRYDPADAVPGAANYLEASGAPGDWKKALFAYNHADWYVKDVLRQSRDYCGKRYERRRPGRGDRRGGDHRDRRGGDHRDRRGGDHRDRRGGDRRSARRSPMRQKRLKTVRWALRQEGTSEYSDKVARWSRRAGWSSVPAWCGIFVHEAWLRAGLDLDNRMAAVKFIHDSAGERTNHFKAIRLEKARRGDLLVIDWPGVGDSDDHVAIVRRRADGGSIPVISGNTGDDDVSKDLYDTSVVQMAVRVT
jgi:hypothetical protein